MLGKDITPPYLHTDRLALENPGQSLGTVQIEVSTGSLMLSSDKDLMTKTVKHQLYLY